MTTTHSTWNLEPFARDCGHAGPSFHSDKYRRLLLCAELAALFHFYGVTDLKK